jgi:hypothetical protein
MNSMGRENHVQHVALEVVGYGTRTYATDNRL